MLVVEVQPGDRLVGTWVRRLLRYGQQVPCVVHFPDTIALWVADRVAEQGGALQVGYFALETIGETQAVEDVIAEYQRDGVVTDELPTDHEGLCQPVRTGLWCITELETELAAVTEQGAETRQILGSGDHQNLSDAGQHQHRQRIVDHRRGMER